MKKKKMAIINDAKDHTSDFALACKINDTWRLGYICQIRRLAAARPEVNTEGRTASYDYLGEKRWYDANGVDEDGFYPDGESATPGEYNRDGWRREKSPSGRRRAYNREGRDISGYDHDGYDEKGFDRQGLDRFGFNRAGIHSVTHTERDAEGYNAYGADSEGRLRNGEIHPAIILANELLAQPRLTLARFAQQNSIDQDELAKQLELAKKLLPQLVEPLQQRSQRNAAQAIAILWQDVERLKSCKLTFAEFWGKHPKLELDKALQMMGSDFARVLWRKICSCDLKSHDSVHVIVAMLGANSAPDAIERVKTLHEFISTEESCKVGRLVKYLEGFSNQSLKDLYHWSFSIDGGKTMIQTQPDDIAWAKTQIKTKGGLICRRTVRRAIVEKYRNNKAG